MYLTRVGNGMRKDRPRLPDKSWEWDEEGQQVAVGTQQDCSVS